MWAYVKSENDNNLKRKKESISVLVGNVGAITLSDSDTDTSSGSTPTKKKARWSTQEVDPSAASPVVDLSSTMDLCDDSICDVTSTTETAPRDASADLQTPAGTNEENNSNELDDSVIIIEDNITTTEIPRPVRQRLLRPVVIDGSNVARLHGHSMFYSTKGIKLSVEFFLRRGHPKVTAFVPQFRRFRIYGRLPTRDPDLLEALAVKQHVVFTPSRRVEGKLLVSDSDRYIVQLAAQTGGVILSNKNYRRFSEESEEFSKVIRERLLKYCFARDHFMVPNDPMGRGGPCLDEYLSFPVEAASSSPT